MKRARVIFLGLAVAAGIVIATAVEPHPPSFTTTVSASNPVYARPARKTYHAQECNRLAHVRPSEIIKLNQDDAEASGYIACNACFRP